VYSEVTLNKTSTKLKTSHFKTYFHLRQWKLSRHKMRTVSEHSQAQTAYEPTLWAKVFHSVPHVNITFHSVNSQFNPENDLYLESLGILASIPAAWLITTLVNIFLIASKLGPPLNNVLLERRIWFSSQR